LAFGVSPRGQWETCLLADPLQLAVADRCGQLRRREIFFGLPLACASSVRCALTRNFAKDIELKYVFNPITRQQRAQPRQKRDAAAVGRTVCGADEGNDTID
jgi:hypothetical protein